MFFTMRCSIPVGAKLCKTQPSLNIRLSPRLQWLQTVIYQDIFGSEKNYQVPVHTINGEY